MTVREEKDPTRLLQGLTDEELVRRIREGETVGLVVETGCSYFASVAFPSEAMVRKVIDALPEAAARVPGDAG